MPIPQGIEAKSTQNPTTPKLLNTLMLLPILHTTEENNALVNISQSVNSLHCTVEKKQRYASVSQSYFQQRDGSTPDVRINIHR